MKKTFAALIILCVCSLASQASAQNQERQDPLQFAATLYRLAEIAEQDGKLEQAELWYKTAFDVREKALGPEHFLVGYTAAKLATVYSARKNVVEATEYSTRALRILEKNLGAAHPIVVKLKQDLLVVQMSGGKPAAKQPKRPNPAAQTPLKTRTIQLRGNGISRELQIKSDEEGFILLELKPKGTWVPFFGRLTDLPPELADSEDEPWEWVEGTSSNDVCSILNLNQKKQPDALVSQVRNSAKALLAEERPFPMLYCAARSFADTANAEDIPDLKNLLNRDDVHFFIRLEAARGLLRVLGAEEFENYRKTLQNASVMTRVATALIAVEMPNGPSDEELISLAKETPLAKADWSFRAKVLELLLKVSDPNAVPVLENALKDEYNRVSMRALQILFLKAPEANIERLANHLLSEDTTSYEYERALQILAGAVARPKVLYDVLPKNWLVKLKIIGLLREKLLRQQDDLTVTGAFVDLSDIFAKPIKEQRISTWTLAAMALWEQGSVTPPKIIYEQLEFLSDQSWKFAPALARMRIGILMDFFEKRWNQLVEEPDKAPWTLLLYHEALGLALQSPFEKDRRRAETIVRKGLESQDLQLQLLAARAELIARLETESSRKKASQEFLFYYHDKADFDEFGSLAVGRLTLEPKVKQTAEGLVVQLNQTVVWTTVGIGFANFAKDNTRNAVGKNGEALIQSVELVHPKGKTYSPAAPLKDGSVLFPVKDLSKQPGWTLRVKCVYKTLGQDAQEQTLEFPLE